MGSIQSPGLGDTVIRPPGVLAVVVCWNSGDWLPACLEALKRQTFSALRVVVWDNASDPQTLSVLDELAGRYPDIVFHRSSQNLGFAAGNNRAAALWPDSWAILTVNPDAVLADDCVEHLVAAMQADPIADAIGCTQLSMDGERIDGLGDSLHVSGIIWREGHGQPVVPGLLSGPIRPIFSPCAAVALYRRGAFQAVGGFDEAFFCYAEDVDLGYRLRLNGGRCLHVPWALARHAGSASTGADSPFTVYHGHRNLVWCYVKNTPMPLFWVTLPLHLAMTLVTMISLLLRGRGRAILRAKRDAIRGVPAVWRQRRASRSKVRATAMDVFRAMTVSPFRR